MQAKHFRKRIPIEVLTLTKDLTFDKKVLNRSGKKVWIRQVVVPSLMDNDNYLSSLVREVRSIKNVEKIDFLPYHNMGISKYEELGIEYPYKGMDALDKEKCIKLHDKFMKMYNEKA